MRKQPLRLYHSVLLSDREAYREEDRVVYDSQYGPNSPLYECISVECVDIFPDRKWYDVGRHWRSKEQLKAFVYKWGTEDDSQDPARYAIYSHNSPLMWLWDKTPQYGNCD